MLISDLIQRELEIVLVINPWHACASSHSSVLLTSTTNCCVSVYKDYLDSMASYKQLVIICARVYILILHTFISWTLILNDLQMLGLKFVVISSDFCLMLFDLVLHRIIMRSVIQIMDMRHILIKRASKVGNKVNFFTVYMIRL